MAPPIVERRFTVGEGCVSALFLGVRERELFTVRGQFRVGLEEHGDVR